MLCQKCGIKIEEYYNYCPVCAKLVKTVQLTNKKHTVALKNSLEGFVIGFSDGIQRGSVIFLVGGMLTFMGLYIIGIMIILVAAIVALALPLLGSINYREGACPCCGFKLSGVIKDNGITCKTCQNRFILKDGSFHAV